MIRYKAEKVGEKWQIFVYPHWPERAIKYAEAGGKEYPSRQNAYARTKQLNDRAAHLAQYIPTIYFRIVVNTRDAARAVRRYIDQMAQCSVVDPLFDDPGIRFVEGMLACRVDDDVSDPSRPPWRQQPPTAEEFHEFLKCAGDMPDVAKLETSYVAL